MFSPRLALASLSGRSDAIWAREGSPFAGAAFLGGIALDEPTRAAARAVVARGREEFLPADPLAFVDRQLEQTEELPVQPAINVRSTSTAPIRAVAHHCVAHDALLEINAHCRQPEFTDRGCGETLLADTERLERFVRAAAEAGATVGVKARAEVPEVDLSAVARAVAAAGGAFVHLDAMDTAASVGTVDAAADLFVIANNGVRDRDSVRTYVDQGADAVSVGRASDDPAVLARVRRAVYRELGPPAAGHQERGLSQRG